MRVGDAASVEYARSQIGREEQRRSVPVRGRGGRSVGRQELQDGTHLIPESDLERLEDGEAIVVVPDGWIRGLLVRFTTNRPQLCVHLKALQSSGRSLTLRGLAVGADVGNCFDFTTKEAHSVGTSVSSYSDLMSSDETGSEHLSLSYFARLVDVKK